MLENLSIMLSSVTAENMAFCRKLCSESFITFSLLAFKSLQNSISSSYRKQVNLSGNKRLTEVRTQIFPDQILKLEVRKEGLLFGHYSL